MASDVFQQSQSFFDPRNPIFNKSILQVQTDPSNPQHAQLDSATGALLPDVSTQSRFDNFPADLYDLRPQSHLVRFLRALIGDSGTGQLRKKYLITRIQAALTSTHFYDLDRFYGALFNAQRRVEELLPINPLTGTATSDEWDDLHGKDALYRERIVALAKSIAMGGTVPGIQAAAEAITGVPCDIYESWALMDQAGPASGGGSSGGARTWDDVEADFPTWDDTATETWDSLTGSVQIGRATSSRSEFIVRPKQDYSRIADPDVRARTRAQDEYGLIRVLSVLKPAGTLLTVDFDGVPMHTPVKIAAVSAESEFWEVTAQVTPRPSIRTGTQSPYPTSALDSSSTTAPHTLPRPPFTQVQGEMITYNSDVVAVSAYAEVSAGIRVAQRDYELVTYYDGKQVAYSPDKAVLDTRRALAARYAADGVLVAHPYAGDREAVMTSG